MFQQKLQKTRILCSVVLLFLLSASSALAGDWVWKDGYWWRDGEAWEPYRVHVTTPYYHYEWRYRKVPVVTKTVTVNKKTINIEAPDFWETLAVTVREAKENEARLAALRAFGANVGAYNVYGNFNKQNLIQQGSTEYGYSYNTIHRAYKDIDTMVLYDQSYRLSKHSLDAAERANALHSNLVALAGEDAARIAEIRATKELVAEVLRKVRTEKYQANTSSSPQVTSPEIKAQSTDKLFSLRLNTFKGIVASKCLKCHNAQKKEGGLDLSDVTILTEGQADKILVSIKSTDPAKRMPKAGSDGKGGDPLSAAEVELFESMLAH